MLAAKEDLYNRVFVAVYMKERATMLAGEDLADFGSTEKEKGREAALDAQQQKDAARAAKEASLCSELAYPWVDNRVTKRREPER